MSNKMNFALEVLFAALCIAFIHFMILVFSPGPMPAEIRKVLDWFTQ